MKITKSNNKYNVVKKEETEESLGISSRIPDSEIDFSRYDFFVIGKDVRINLSKDHSHYYLCDGIIEVIDGGYCLFCNEYINKTLIGKYSIFLDEKFNFITKMKSEH